MHQRPLLHGSTCLALLNIAADFKFPFGKNQCICLQQFTHSIQVIMSANPKKITAKASAVAPLVMYGFVTSFPASCAAGTLSPLKKPVSELATALVMTSKAEIIRTMHILG